MLGDHRKGNGGGQQGSRSQRDRAICAAPRSWGSCGDSLSQSANATSRTVSHMPGVTLGAWGRRSRAHILKVKSGRAQGERETWREDGGQEGTTEQPLLQSHARQPPQPLCTLTHWGHSLCSAPPTLRAILRVCHVSSTLSTFIPLKINLKAVRRRCHLATPMAVTNQKQMPSGSALISTDAASNTNQRRPKG